MNINELYDSIPADQHGKIVVSAGTVTITMADESAVKLLRESQDDTAQLTDTGGEAVELVHLELLKAAAKLSNSSL